MAWDIDFITKEDFKEHVKSTIKAYGEKLDPYDLKKFNNNIIDPIKMVFDRAVYNKNWEAIVSDEILRQRDKSNANEIGYFHQRIFEYIDGCTVPKNGQQGGWDIIFQSPNGYTLDNGDVVHTIYVELKNKHNTMNSSAAGKTYIKMQHQLLANDDCACFLVEVIARRSQNIAWNTTVDNQKLSHARIRRVSIDKFYEIVTGDPDAFYKICMALPAIVKEVLNENQDSQLPSSPHDSVFEEISARAKDIQNKSLCSDDAAMALSMYMLGFSTYAGFKTLASESNSSSNPT